MVLSQAELWRFDVSVSDWLSSLCLFLIVPGLCARSKFN